MAAKRKMKLYWASTGDHHEDWFIVAATAQEAAKLHEDLEGYNPGEARVEEILAIPADLPVDEPGWPSHDLLLALGATFISKEDSRVVEIGGKAFCEGLLASTINEKVDDLFEQMGQDRLNKTKRGPDIPADLFGDEDNDDGDLDDIFGPEVMGECQGCDCFANLDDLGLCDLCSDKLARDLIRKRDWAYSALAFGVPKEKQEDLRKKVIAQYGEKLELIAPSGKSGSPRKRKNKKKRRKGKGH